MKWQSLHWLTLVPFSFALALCAAANAAPVAPAAPESASAPQTPAFDISAVATLDLVSVQRGGTDSKVRALSNIDLIMDADLDQLTGWKGARAHVYLLDNRGLRPNDSAGTLQGVNSIEVPTASLRLFEAWVEQDLPGGASILAGLYNVSSEFYMSESAGMLMAASFGTAPEFAASGTAGPSIPPSSAAGVRLKVPFDKGLQLLVTAVNAKAQTLGDPGGIDTSFSEGVLLIAQGGLVEGPVRAQVGVWGYSRAQESHLETDADGNALRRPSNGVYALLEGDILPAAATHKLTAFLHVGKSAEYDTPFSGGIQTGALLAPLFTGRPSSELTFGVQHAWVTGLQRQALIDEGKQPARGETGFEVMYSDRLFGAVTIQPDLQWIRHPGADATAPDELIVSVRLRLGL